MTADEHTPHVYALRAGTLLHEFRIEAVLGYGGFGITHRALDTELRKAVAINELAARVYHEDSSCSFRNPGFEQNSSHPVVCINWNEAKAYVAWLSRKTYRLLTEAEWEYAPRAGTKTRFYWGDGEKVLCRRANGDDRTSTCKDGYKYTAPVGKFAPNGFRLHGMFGNAEEWVGPSVTSATRGAG